MAPVGPWAQPKATRREGGRRAERPAGSYATPDTPCSRTAPEGSLPTERGQTVPALRPELDGPNLFGSSNRSVPADRSPRPREAEGRLAPEMAESHEARSQAQAQRRAWPQCDSRRGPPLESPCCLLSLVLSFDAKESAALSGRQSHHSRRSRRVMSPGMEFSNRVIARHAGRGLSARPLHPFGLPKGTYARPHGTTTPNPWAHQPLHEALNRTAT